MTTLEVSLCKEEPLGLAGGVSVRVSTELALKDRYVSLRDTGDGEIVILTKERVECLIEYLKRALEVL